MSEQRDLDREEQLARIENIKADTQLKQMGLNRRTKPLIKSKGVAQKDLEKRDRRDAWLYGSIGVVMALVILTHIYL